MKKNRLKVGVAGLLIVTSATTAWGQTSSGARPGDKEMTCEQVAKEQAQINKDVEKQAGRKAAGKKVGKSLFGFAKNFAASTIPTAISGMGGSSVVGAAAARAASQSAGTAIYDAGRSTGNSAQPEVPTASPEQQARLDRLAKIGAYRQCPAG